MEDIGALDALTTNDEVDRWLNDGRIRLGQLIEKDATLTWANGATSVALPSDFVSNDAVRVPSGSSLPVSEFREKVLRFLDSTNVSAGTATLYYKATPALMTGAVASELDPRGDQAIVSYALYRFFRKVAANRSDYTQYATVSGINAVDINELLDLAKFHYDEFIEARSEETLPEPAHFFGE